MVITFGRWNTTAATTTRFRLKKRFHFFFAFFPRISSLCPCHSNVTRRSGTAAVRFCLRRFFFFVFGKVRRRNKPYDTDTVTRVLSSDKREQRRIHLSYSRTGKKNLRFSRVCLCTYFSYGSIIEYIRRIRRPVRRILYDVASRSS